MRITERITGIEDTFHTIHTHYGLAVLSGRIAGPDIKRFGKLLESIETAQSAMLAMVKDKPAWHPTTPERIESLADGLEHLAREKGACLNRADALHSLLVERLSGAIQAYWAGAGHHELYGMIRNQPEVAELLRERGIEVWANDQDRHIRLVNTSWLERHADIYIHVDPHTWQGGRRCRFCCINEIPTSRELIPVEPERRKGYVVKNDQHVMQLGVHAHETCIQYWKRWLAIAQQYASLAEAQAADVAAGRTTPAPSELLEEKQ